MTGDEINQQLDAAAERPCQFCGARPATVHGFRVVDGFVSLCRKCFGLSIGRPVKKRWPGAKHVPSRSTPLFQAEAGGDGTAADFQF